MINNYANSTIFLILIESRLSKLIILNMIQNLKTYDGLIKDKTIYRIKFYKN